MLTESAPARAGGHEPEQERRPADKRNDTRTVARERSELQPLDRLAVDAREAAELHHVSERHWRSLHAQGLVPAPVTLSACVRWRVDDLRRWSALGCPSRERFEELTREGAGGAR